MIEKACVNCKWSRFEMTGGKNPRFTERAGSCLWPMPPPINYPLSITKLNAFRMNPSSRAGIWPGETGCPVWEAATETARET